MGACGTQVHVAVTYRLPMPRVVWDMVRFDIQSSFNTSGVITLTQNNVDSITLKLSNCCQSCLVDSGKIRQSWYTVR